MSNGYFKMVCVSDLHFGSPRIDAADLYSKLKMFLYPEVKDAHLVTIGGDLYDQLLTINSKAHKYAALFIHDLFVHSAKTGTEIRILHGTFSHDRDQLSIFNTFAFPETKYRIVNEIEVEEIPRFRCGLETIEMPLRIGYLPDNLAYTKSQEAVDHLRRAMDVVGYTQLDLIIGHGTFDYALPKEVSMHGSSAYTLDQLSSVVAGPIVMGHIHTSSRKYNCYYTGSFERMAHGEEERKGFYVFTKDIKNTGGWRAKFIENKFATPFVTITPKGTDISEITRDFVEQVKTKIPRLSGYVRAVHDQPEVRAVLHKVCAQQFPNITFSSKTSGELTGERQLKVDDIDLTTVDDIKPTRNNLEEIIWQFLTEHDEAKDITRKDLNVKLTEILSETSI